VSLRNLAPHFTSESSPFLCWTQPLFTFKLS
jgi:hypothetical protein